MPRIRFSVRWVLVAVAIVAMLLAGRSMLHRRATYLLRAEEENSLETTYRRDAERTEQAITQAESQTAGYLRAASALRRGQIPAVADLPPIFRGDLPNDDQMNETQAHSCESFARDAQELADRLRRTLPDTRARASYHSVLRRKYEDAARRPWLSTPPDPPEPSWLYPTKPPPV